MKTLIVFTHPHEGSYGYSILEAVKAGLKKGGHACKVINLNKDNFDPVMREKDLKAFDIYLVSFRHVLHTDQEAYQHHVTLILRQKQYWQVSSA